MKKIKLMNKIAACGTDLFDRREYEVSDTVEHPDAILVRSANLHGMPVDPALLAVARAGAGVNNIPKDELAKAGVVVFNTPGANANGVKELAVAALLLASRDIVGGIGWADTLAGEPDVAAAVEAGKSKFSGKEIYGKTLGVIGLGAIGGMVANVARSLGMNVIGYDPYLTVHAAWSISSTVRNAQSTDELYAAADYISLHVPATGSTRGMINQETLSKMKDGVRVINLSRADLVVTGDMKEALSAGKVAAYVTDFPTAETLRVPNIINIPHLGASTEESEDNCAVMAAEELMDYLVTGNIRNSVNYPAVSLPYTGAVRICLCHRNIANTLSSITSIVSGAGINIENLSNGSMGEFAYTMVEIGVAVPEEILPALRKIPGMIRVRVI